MLKKQIVIKKYIFFIKLFKIPNLKIPNSKALPYGRLEIWYLNPINFVEFWNWEFVLLEFDLLEFVSLEFIALPFPTTSPNANPTSLL